MKEFTDYMGRHEQAEPQDKYVEITCAMCGDIISYCVDDNSLSQTFCTSCFDELYPDSESDNQMENQ